MASAKIVDMTIDDIKALIAEVVDERLHNWWQQSRDTRFSLLTVILHGFIREIAVGKSSVCYTDFTDYI